MRPARKAQKEMPKWDWLVLYLGCVFHCTYPVLQALASQLQCVRIHHKHYVEVRYRWNIVCHEFIDGKREWYLNEMLHRADGPAVEWIPHITYVCLYEKYCIPRWLENSHKEWWLFGKRHRTDGPAIVRQNGSQEWYINSTPGRVDGPARVHPDGTLEWYWCGAKHRADGPAVIQPTGQTEWYFNGFRHRENGPAIVCPDGDQVWYYRGECHRRSGPARELSDGYKEWRQHDRLHREDGPAVVRPNGDKEWYFNGKRHRRSGPAAVFVGGYQRMSNDLIRAEDGLGSFLLRYWGSVAVWRGGHYCASWLNGQRHRSGAPAVVHTLWFDCPLFVSHYSTWWYDHGQLHRENGPAVELADGTKMWYHRGRLHRRGGPAVLRLGGSCEYWQNGRMLMALKR